MAKIYNNPPISEAVCEFRFGIEGTFSDEIVDRMYEDLKATHGLSLRTKGKRFHMQYTLNAVEGTQAMNKDEHEFDQLSAADGKTFVQIDGARLSIHRLKPYTSWEAVYPLVCAVFDAYVKYTSEKVKIESIERVGVRYINVIDIRENGFNPRDYFNIGVYTTSELPEHLATFAASMVFIMKEGRDFANVQLVDRRVSTPDLSSFLYDIDYFLAVPGTISLAQAKEWVDEAHKEVELLFEGGLTEQTKSLFT